MVQLKPLIVDDSVVVRRVLSEMLEALPETDEVCCAENGEAALGMVASRRPNIVILDINMPVMDGWATLEKLRRDWPELPVLIFSSEVNSQRISRRALRLGADDVMSKPERFSQSRREELLQQLQARLSRLVSRRRAPAANSRVAGWKPAIVAIGLSTGGPTALEQVISGLPATFPVPIVIVQHMPPTFTRLLAERLNAVSSLTVAEGFDGAQLTPGTVWIAPGGRHMEVTHEETLLLHDGPLECSCRPAVDVLFRSVADVFQGQALGVILTGMGRDGLNGSEAIHEAGGRVIVQDEASSVIWGMPGVVSRAGLAAEEFPLDLLSMRLKELTRI